MDHELNHHCVNGTSIVASQTAATNAINVIDTRGAHHHLIVLYVIKHGIMTLYHIIYMIRCLLYFCNSTDKQARCPQRNNQANLQIDIQFVTLKTKVICDNIHISIYFTSTTLT